MLFQCWASVVDDGPTLKQHWFNALCLLGYSAILVGRGICIHLVVEAVPSINQSHAVTPTYKSPSLTKTAARQSCPRTAPRTTVPLSLLENTRNGKRWYNACSLLVTLFQHLLLTYTPGSTSAGEQVLHDETHIKVVQ